LAEEVDGAVRVLYVIDSLVAGGAERSLATMAPYLISEGVELDVAYLHERPGVRLELEDAGASLFPLTERAGRIGWAQRVTRLTRARRPDLIHTTLFEADIAGRIAGRITGTPTVGSLVNIGYGDRQAAAPSIRPWKLLGAQRLDMITARSVVRFHAVTREVAVVMSDRLAIPNERIEVIPRGRDPRRLGVRTPERRREARLGLGIGDGGPLILAAGRQEYQKGFDVLLDAVADARREIPGLRVLLAGRAGNETDSLRAQARRLGLQDIVRFLGARDDLPELMCACDAFVLSSRWEGLPGVLLEAMALEAPTIATDIPPVAEILVDGMSGRVVSVGDPRAMARALVDTLQRPQRAAVWATRAHASFERRFTIDRVSKAMVAFYDHALAAERVRTQPQGEA
jgi:glycosyltransferase involved in cell wall biosynthesis